MSSSGRPPPAVLSEKRPSEELLPLAPGWAREESWFIGVGWDVEGEREAVKSWWGC